MVKTGWVLRPGKRSPGGERNVVKVQSCGGHKVAVLAAGSARCARGTAAARIAAETVAGFLAFRFCRCLLEHPEVVRRELALAVTQALKQAALASGSPGRDFGCTFLAAAMDETGLCAFHLGDGMILEQGSGEMGWNVLSYPQSGLTPEGDPRTMEGPVFDCLRFYRKKRTGGRVMLMSGGFLRLRRPELTDHPELLASLEPEDDCAAAWLQAVPERTQERTDEP